MISKHELFHLHRRSMLRAVSLTTLASASQLSTPAWSQSVSLPSKTQPKIGLALGAGSARGFAHIGVLKSLDQAGIKAHMLAGTSAGSLAGIFYAAGFTPWQMEEVALKVRDVDVADFSTASKRGMLAGEALQKLVNEYCRGAKIEQLKLPYAAIATNLKTGDSAMLRTGDCGMAVRASCSIPGVFVPATIEGQELVDGGLTSPLPVKEVRSLGADFVIAVDVGSRPQNNTNAGLYEVLLQSFEIMGRALTQAAATQADIVIRPDTLRYSSTDFSARKDIIQAGYEATQKMLPQIMAKLGEKGLKRK
jgi:NTE family protein